MTRFFTLLGLALAWLPLQAQRLSPSSPQAAPYVLRPTPTPVKTLGLEDFFPQLRQSRSQVGANPTLRLGGKGNPASLSSVALPVQAGQLVEAQLWAYAQKPAPWLSKRLPLAIGAAALSSQLSLPGRAEGSLSPAQSLTLPLLTAGAVLAPPLVKALTGGRKAYARLRFYDGQGRLVQESTQSVSKQARKSGELVSLRLRAPQAGFVQLQVVNKGKQEVSFEEGQMAGPRPLMAVPGLLPTAADSLSSQQDSLEALLSVRAPVKQGDPCTGCDGPPGGGMDGGTLPTVTIVAPPMPSPMYFTNYTLPNSNYGLYPSPEPGSSSIVSGSSVGSNSSMNALTRIIPRHPVDGQLFTYRDSQGNLVTLIYHAATQSWLLPALNVKGAPKTGLYDGKTFTSTTGIRYIYLQDYWSYPVLKAPPPPPIDNEIEIVLDPCSGYKRMLALQRAKGKEASAFLTKDGKTIILPMEKNTATTAKTFAFYEDSKGKKVLSVYQAEASDAPTLVPGQWYLTTATHDAQGRTHHTTYLLAGHVHTHPLGHSGTNEPSPEDITFAKKGFPGLPTYIVNENNLLEYGPAGAIRTTPNACK